MTTLTNRPGTALLVIDVQNGVVVIPKSSNPERIRSNADVGGFRLSDEQMVRIDGLGA